MMMKRVFIWLLIAGVASVIAGCGWESPGTDDTWDEGNDWANFSGLYRNPGGGAMVVDYEITPGYAAVTNKVTSEAVAKGQGGGTTAYFGTLENTPVVPNSVVIAGGTFVLTDNGVGVLVGNFGTTGTIDYGTGAWTVDLKAGGTIVLDEAIIGSYEYVVGGTSGKIESGATGTIIYTMNVQQQGNLLTFTDSDGMSYTGRLDTVTSTTGEIAESSRGMVMGSFAVKGISKTGVAVTISGTLSAVRQKVTEEFTTSDEGSTSITFSFFYLTWRNIEATWIEKNSSGTITRTADVVGGTQDVIFERVMEDSVGSSDN